MQDDEAVLALASSSELHPSPGEPNTLRSAARLSRCAGTVLPSKLQQSLASTAPNERVTARR